MSYPNLFDDARWFESLGKCQCGKPANGWVNNSRNAKMAATCERCADKIIKQARIKRGETVQLIRQAAKAKRREK